MYWCFVLFFFSHQRELESRLEKEVAEVKKLSKELETVTWDNAAESLVYFEVVDAMSEEWSNTITTMQVKLFRISSCNFKLDF